MDILCFGHLSTYHLAEKDTKYNVCQMKAQILKNISKHISPLIEFSFIFSAKIRASSFVIFSFIRQAIVGLKLT